MKVQGVAGAVPGALLAAVLGVTAVVRRTKPLHPRGRVGSGVLSVTSPDRELGVPLLAATGEHPCTVRWSRAMGLPAPVPDVEGFAVRFAEPTADVLFAATGTGRIGRFLLVPRLARRHGPQTTLLPVATEAGSLLLKVTPLDDAEPPTRWELAVARAGSSWSPVGTIRVDWGNDEPLRFDPVEHQLPGTVQYPVVRTMREPAYVAARLGARV
ncbi:MAG TPA: hypothetical protein VFG72_01185 [Marmoricola sp.]|nr:hypothetical protein [Marmoricola sp.]